MSAKHALLGLLLDRPAYPYQLADRLSQRLGPAWEVNSGQLYQLVKKLEDDGLIERVHGADGAGGEGETGGTRDGGTRDIARARGQRARGRSESRQERHVYSITDEGVSEFERWFEQGGTSTSVRLCRRPLIVKITFAGPKRLADALAKLDAYELQCAERLQEIARMREELPGDGPLVRADHLLLRLNLSADIFQLEGELRWARHAREMLSWLDSREAVWPAGAGRERGAGERALGWPGARAGAPDETPTSSASAARRKLFERQAREQRGRED